MFNCDRAIGSQLASISYLMARMGFVASSEVEVRDEFSRVVRGLVPAQHQPMPSSLTEMHPIPIRLHAVECAAS